MNTITKTLLAGPLAILLTAGLSGQNDPRLARAQILEQAEHDLKAAATAYSELAEAKDATRRTQTDALLRLGRVHQRLGDSNAAAAAFLRASTGTGPSAQAAKLLLQQDPKDGPKDDVTLQVLEQIGSLQNEQSTQQATHYLVRIGPPAVPWLVQAADREKSDLPQLTRLATVLFQIGGEGVEKWIGGVQRNYSALRRHAVLDAAAVTTATDPKVRRALSRFVADPEAKIRLRTIKTLHPILSAEDAIGLLKDPDAAVRASTWRIFELPLRLDPPSDDEQLFKLIEQLLDAPDSQVHIDAIHSYVTTTARVRLWSTVTGRDYFLRCVLRIPPTASLALPKLETYGDDQPDQHADALLRVARHGKSGEFRNFVQLSLRGLEDTWTVKSLPTVMELMKLGFQPTQPWLRKNVSASPEVAFAALSNLDDNSVYRVVDAVGGSVELPAKSITSMKSWVAEALRNPDPTRAAEGAIGECIERLSTRVDQDEWLIEFVTQLLPRSAAIKNANKRLALANVAINQIVQRDSPERRKALRRLATTDFPLSGASAIRGRALARLLQLGEKQLEDVFATGYSIGFASAKMPSGPAGRGVGWLVEGQKTIAENYSEAERVSMIDAALATGEPRVWDDLDDPAGNRYPPAVRDVIMKHWQDANVEMRANMMPCLSNSEPSDAVDAAFADMLKHEDPEVRLSTLYSFYSVDQMLPNIRRNIDRFIEALDDPSNDVVKGAIRAISNLRDESLVPKLAPFAQHPSVNVRRELVRGLQTIGGEASLNVIVTMFDDESNRVRNHVIDVAQQTLDKRFVPGLIRELRDESLRGYAKQVLDAVRYYHDEKARWERLLNENGIDSNNAAEALLKQAKSDDKRIRLVAIQSLGTLAVPETLPFLIQLMGDDDPDIRKAAAASVERINRKGEGK